MKNFNEFYEEVLIPRRLVPIYIETPCRKRNTNKGKDPVTFMSLNYKIKKFRK